MRDIVDETEIWIEGQREAEGGLRSKEIIVMRERWRANVDSIKRNFLVFIFFRLYFINDVVSFFLTRNGTVSHIKLIFIYLIIIYKKIILIYIILVV